MRIAAALALAGSLAVSAAGATTPSAITLRGEEPLGGLAVAAGHVYWTRDQRAGPPSLYTLRGGRETRLWTGRDVPLPAGESGPLVGVGQRADVVAASQALVGIVYSATFYRRPPPGVYHQIISRPLFSEIWVGPPEKLRKVSGFARPCPGRWFAAGVDVSGRRVAYSEVRHLSCADFEPVERRVVVGSLINGRWHASVVDRSRGPYPVTTEVALAGRYVAWEAGDAAAPRLVVYDLRSRRVAYRVGPRALSRSANPAPFDVQADGTVAVLADGKGCPGGQLVAGWASVKEPRLHVVSRRASYGRIRIASGRIAFQRSGCSGAEPRLVVSNLRGRQRVVGEWTPASMLTGDFDVGGRMLAYVATDAAAGRQTIYLGRT